MRIAFVLHAGRGERFHPSVFARQLGQPVAVSTPGAGCNGTLQGAEVSADGSFVTLVLDVPALDMVVRHGAHAGND